MKKIIAESIEEIRSEIKTEFRKSYPIDTANWVIAKDVEAKFSIANDSKNIFLRYTVQEKNILGRFKEINDPVYRDSCVEFFISFDNTHYYNFEFNCIGTVLGAYGSNRNDRIQLDKEILEQISSISSLGENKITVEGSDTEWRLDIIIPIETFVHTQIDSFSDVSAMCNAYKCGDDLPEPHFLSWSPVGTEKPDFHRPDFFGKLILAK